MSIEDMPKTGTWEQRGGWVVRALMQDIGLTAPQAAGLVGNLGYESAGFTKLQEVNPSVPGSKGGYGWAQWTASRRRAFEAWCTEVDLPPSSDEANYGFLCEELIGTHKSFAAKLKKTTSIEEACTLTHKLYETPSDVLDGSYRSAPARLKYAQRALTGANALPDVSGEPIDDPELVADLVRALQRILIASGDYDGKPDGIWGKGSQLAIETFQKRNKQ